MNIVDPIGDASLLFTYDTTRILVPIILASIVAFACFCNGLLTWLDKRREQELNELKKDQFVMSGAIGPEDWDFVEHPIWRNIIYVVRNEHNWVSTISPDTDQILLMTRPQRMMTLLL